VLDYGGFPGLLLGVLQNTRCVHCVTFLKSEKFLILKHIGPKSSGSEIVDLYCARFEVLLVVRLKLGCVTI